MLLKTIKASRSPERVNLIFADGFYLPFLIEDVYRLKLARNQEIDTNQLSHIINLSLTYLAYSYTLRQIALSPKNQTVLKRKLTQYLPRLIYKYNLSDYQIDKNQLVSDVLTKIDKAGLADERNFVRSYLNRHPHRSRRRLHQELLYHGVSPELITELLPSCLYSESEKINRYLAKKAVTANMLADSKQKNKIMAALARQGFAYDDIMAAIDDLVK